MRRGRKGNKELAAVGVRALVGHADNAVFVVSQPRPDLVFKGWPVDGAASFGVIGWTGVGRRAGLCHEGGDYAVDRGEVVVRGCAEGEEVLGEDGVLVGVLTLLDCGGGSPVVYLGGFGDALAKYFDFEVPVGGV
jgi:hypothetical protein